MTLALHGKTRARQCAFFGAALAAVVAAAVAGGVLPGAERSGAAGKPDLVATKSHTGTPVLGSTFTWKIAVRNSGTAPVSFASYYVVFRDDLPPGNTYVFNAKTNQGMDANELAQLTCAIYGSAGSQYLRCKPSSNAAVDIPAGAGFDLELLVTPSTGGQQTNPSENGKCAADPDNAITNELDEDNNVCTDTVNVLTATTRTVNIVKVVTGANAPSATFEGNITGASTNLTWQTTGAGADTQSGVAAEALTVVETTGLSSPWSFGGYAVLAGTTSDCSNATFTGDQATGISVPAAGDQTVCIKNIYTPPSPTVSIAKSHSGNSPFAPGDSFDWVITASVADGPTLVDATIVDSIPSGFTVNSVVVSDPHNDPDRLGCNPVTNGALNCTLSSGAATGSGYTITINVTVDRGGVCGKVANTATIDSQTTVANEVTILCGGDPTVEKGDAVLVDGRLRWVITVANPAEYAQDVAITDSDSSAVAVSSTCNGAVSGAGPWICGVPAKGSATITVETELPASPDVCSDHTVTNTASITGATDSGSYAIRAVADASCLSVTKQNTGNGAWAITFVNRGPTATGVSFTETYTAAGQDTIVSVSGGTAVCTGTGEIRDCILDLPPGETVVSVATTPLLPVCDAQAVANSVAASFGGGDVPATGSGSLTAGFTLPGEPSLCPGTIRIVKTDHTTPATPGRPQSWTIVLTGPSGESRQVPLNDGVGPKETVIEIPGAAVGAYSVAETEAGPAACPTAPGSAASWGTALSQSPLVLEPGGEITFSVTNFPCEAVAGRGALVIEKVEDRNGNGVRDPGESLVEWEVEVTGPEPGFENGRLVTLPGGELTLGGLVAGFYTIHEAIGVDGYRAIGPATVVVEVPNGGEAVARFHNQPQVTVTARKTEVHLAGSSAGAGWQMTISGCGFTETRTTGPDGTVTWTGLALCDYTVAEDPASKPGFFAGGPVSHSVSASVAGAHYEVSFTNYRATTIPECAIACEPVTFGGSQPPAPAPSDGNSPTPAASPTPVETVAGAVTPGAGPATAGMRSTPIAPATGTGQSAPGGGQPAVLVLLGSGLAIALVARAARRRR